VGSAGEAEGVSARVADGEYTAASVAKDFAEAAAADRAVFSVVEWP
jgi:hypothetical protein